ncbi:MAG TPA: DUF4388 domain-containing protein [bacterium]|nr:DUF4388 domain-containing protein [bacterium]
MVKVLLIEASAKIQKQIEEALKRIRFETVHTSWAEEGLELLEKGPFDAVMIHDNLAGMSALAFIKTVRKKEKFRVAPVILFYGKCDPVQRMEAWRAGASDVIEMPFVLPEVLLRLNVRLQTMGRIQKISRTLVESMDMDADTGAEALPSHGSVDKRPLPVCFAMIYRARKTGVLRIIEGKNIRMFYVENGYIRGVHSTRKEESLQRLMLKWIDFPGDTKRHFKSLPDTMPDPDLARTARHLCGLQDEAIDSIVVRFMHHVVCGAMQISRGEFDWAPDEDPRDVLTVKFRGIHPVHLLLTVVRDASPVIDYSGLILNGDKFVAPTTQAGIIRDTYRFTAPEVCVAAITAKGITIDDWLKQARIILPYASAFVFVMLQFRIFRPVERSELTTDEIDAVSLPEPILKETLQAGVSMIEEVEVTEKDTGPAETVGMASGMDETAGIDRQTEPPEAAVTIDSAEPAGPDESRRDGITEVDNRPVSKRILKTSRTQPRKNLLERELEKFGQQTTPHQRYQAIKEAQARKNGGRRFEPSALERFDLDRNQLEEGHTWDTHPALICKLVITHRATGVLTFSDAASETRLFWQKGRLVYAKSSKPSLRIDQVLFDLGFINAEQRKEAASLWDESGGMRSGTGLFQNNIVNVMDLTEAVKEQIRLILKDICNMPAGDYHFAAGPLPQSECIPFDIATERILLQGIREMDELGNLARIIPNLNTMFHQAPDASEKAQELHLEACDISVLNRFRKPASAKSAFAGMDITLQSFKNVLVGLYIIDLLNIQVGS